MVAGTSKTRVALFGGLEGREIETTNGAVHVHMASATSTGLSLPVTFQGDHGLEAGTAQSESTSGTQTILATQGATTDIEIRGFAIWNQTTNSRLEYELRIGTTAIARGGLAAQAAFNHNFIGCYHLSENKSIIGWVNKLDAAVTAIWSIQYKEI